MIAGLSVSRARWVPLLGIVIFGSFLGSEPSMAQGVIDQMHHQTADHCRARRHGAHRAWQRWEKFISVPRLDDTGKTYR